MTHFKSSRIALIGAAIAALLSGPALADPSGQETLLGTPATEDETADKVVTIDSSTRWVNVDQNEVVKFVVHNGAGADKTFMWHFPSTGFAVDLNRVAPAGAIGHPLFAYLRPDPNLGNYE